jgi:hypothetical protein
MLCLLPTTQILLKVRFATVDRQFIIFVLKMERFRWSIYLRLIVTKQTTNLIRWTI